MGICVIHREQELSVCVAIFGRRLNEREAYLVGFQMGPGGCWHDPKAYQVLMWELSFRKWCVWWHFPRWSAPLQPHSEEQHLSPCERKFQKLRSEGEERAVWSPWSSQEQGWGQDQWHNMQRRSLNRLRLEAVWAIVTMPWLSFWSWGIWAWQRMESGSRTPGEQNSGCLRNYWMRYPVLRDIGIDQES